MIMISIARVKIKMITWFFAFDRLHALKKTENFCWELKRFVPFWINFFNCNILNIFHFYSFKTWHSYC